MKRRTALVLGAAVAAALLFMGLRRERPASAVIPAPVSIHASGAPEPRPAPLPRSRAAAAPATILAAADGRVARAEELLSAYRESTRYPPWSRPLRERPDMVSPHHVAARRLPLARADRSPGSARVLLRQDRYYAGAGEAVALSIACEVDSAAVPCELISAFAETAPDMLPVKGAPFAVPFAADDDGALQARFQPSSQGFAGVHGPLRVTVRLRAGGEEGTASFDVESTPDAPATFTGTFREALAAGSLDLYAGLRVSRAGRYLIRARVEDAAGRRFAFVSANEALAAGPEEVRLQLSSNLVADEGAEAPFRLRDVEGFRLEEDTYPDRETMPGLDGIVYTTRRYGAGDFSAAEWESPEKARHVEALSGEIDRAGR